MKHAGHGSVGKRGRLLGLLVGVGVGIGVPGGGWWAEGIEHDSTHLSIVAQRLWIGILKGASGGGFKMFCERHETMTQNDRCRLLEGTVLSFTSTGCATF